MFDFAPLTLPPAHTTQSDYLVTGKDPKKKNKSAKVISWSDLQKVLNNEIELENAATLPSMLGHTVRPSALPVRPAASSAVSIANKQPELLSVVEQQPVLPTSASSLLQQTSSTSAIIDSTTAITPKIMPSVISNNGTRHLTAIAFAAISSKTKNVSSALSTAAPAIAVSTTSQMLPIAIEDLPVPVLSATAAHCKQFSRCESNTKALSLKVFVLDGSFDNHGGTECIKTKIQGAGGVIKSNLSKHTGM